MREEEGGVRGEGRRKEGEGERGEVREGGEEEGVREWEGEGGVREEHGVYEVSFYGRTFSSFSNFPVFKSSSIFFAIFSPTPFCNGRNLGSSCMCIAAPGSN